MASRWPSERLQRLRDSVGATQDAYLDQYLWYEADKRASQCLHAVDAAPEHRGLSNRLKFEKESTHDLV